MKSILGLYNDALNQYNKLESFISELKTNRMYYNDNREILYTGVINRCYSLWETSNKNIAYAYYNHTKDELLRNRTLISNLRLHELPAYITEQGQYNSAENFIYYNLKEELITFTSKNMDINQLNALYKRVGIDIINKLNANIVIKDFLLQDTGAFLTLNNSDKDLANALKEIIQERNGIAHYADIDNQKDLDILIEWTKLYKLLLQEISIIICYEIAVYNKLLDSCIGTVQRYLADKAVLCIDLADNISINKSNLLGILKNNILVDIVQPISFQVDNVEKDVTNNNDKVGLKFNSCFNKSTTMNGSTKIIILS